MKIPEFFNEKNLLNLFNDQYTMFYFFDIYLLHEDEIVLHEDTEVDITYEIPVRDLIQSLNQIDNDLFRNLLETESISSNPRLSELCRIAKYDQAILQCITHRILVARHEYEPKNIDCERIIKAIQKSNQTWIPVNIEPRSGTKWRVMHKLQIACILSCQQWSYSFPTISGGGINDSPLTVAFRNPLWSCTDELEIYLPFPEQEQIVLSLEGIEEHKMQQVLKSIRESQDWNNNLFKSQSTTLFS